LTQRARGILALHAEMADLVRLGAYRAGSDPAVDEAIAVAPRLDAVLRQSREDRTSLADSFARLRAAIEGGPA
jgi:flagellum-specific ATP synthase